MMDEDYNEMLKETERDLHYALDLAQIHKRMVEDPIISKLLAGSENQNDKDNGEQIEQEDKLTKYDVIEKAQIGFIEIEEEDLGISSQEENKLMANMNRILLPTTIFMMLCMIFGMLYSQSNFEKLKLGKMDYAAWLSVWRFTIVLMTINIIIPIIITCYYAIQLRKLRKQLGEQNQ